MRDNIWLKLCRHLVDSTLVHLQSGCQRWTAERRWESKLFHTAAPPVTEGTSRAAAWFDPKERPAAWAPLPPAAPQSTGGCSTHWPTWTDDKPVVVFGAKGHPSCNITSREQLLQLNIFETRLAHDLCSTISDIWEREGVQFLQPLQEQPWWKRMKCLPTVDVASGLFALSWKQWFLKRRSWKVGAYLDMPIRTSLWWKWGSEHSCEDYICPGCCNTLHICSFSGFIPLWQWHFL